MAGVPFDWQEPRSGCTPLIVAAIHGHHQVVELLLSKGSLVNQAAVVTGVYRTPLLCAVECGRLKVVEVLLTKGADVDKAQESGASPLCIAALRGHLAIA